MKISDYYIQELHRAGLIDEQIQEAGIRYALLALKNELLKGVLLVVVFYVLGYLVEFVIMFLLILPIRMTTGGVHFHTNSKCFFFSLGYFASCIILLPSWSFPEAAYVLLLTCSTVLIIIMPLFPSEKRPIISKKKYYLNKVLSVCFIFVIDFILLAGLNSTPFFYCGVWVLFFQSLQLLYLFVKKKGKITC